MRHNSKIIALGVPLLLAGVCAQAQTIADWDFDAGKTVAAPDNSPYASLGAEAGVAQANELGMNNGYTYTTTPPITGSVAYCDVTGTSGASTGTGSYAWRIRGQDNATIGDGWNSAAPVGTQGAQFNASTVGYTGIGVTFDLYTTTQGEANMELAYTLNDTAPTPTWNNLQISYGGSGATVMNNSSSVNTVTGYYLNITGGQNWYNQISATLPAAANGDANFAIEIVNASTGADDVAASGGAYNNNSGNWRFDNVDITGTASAVPEPSVLALLGLGCPGLYWQMRRGRKS
jgi:hypothetical protein